MCVCVCVCVCVLSLCACQFARAHARVYMPIGRAGVLRRGAHGWLPRRMQWSGLISSPFRQSTMRKTLSVSWFYWDDPRKRTLRTPHKNHPPLKPSSPPKSHFPRPQSSDALMRGFNSVRSMCTNRWRHYEVYLSIYLSIYLSMFLIYLSIYLSESVNIYLSINLDQSVHINISIRVPRG